MATGDITSVTVRSDGWSADVVIEGFTTGAQYSFDLAANNVPGANTPFLTVVSEGYDDTGALGTITRTVYLTKVVRKPDPNETSLDETGGGNLTVRIALSDYVYTDDKNGGAGTSGVNPTATIPANWCRNIGGGSEYSNAYTAGAVTNNSTEAYPAVIGQWDHIAGVCTADRVTGTVPVAFNAAHCFGIACVKFDATGLTSAATATATATTETATVRSATNLYAAAWTASLTLTGFTSTESVELRARAYPLVGDASAVLDTDSFTAATDEARGYNKSTVKYLSTIKYAYVSTSGNDGTGVASTTEATAAANPFLSIGKAVQNDATVIYLLAGTHPAVRTAPSSRRTTAEWYVVQPAPGESASTVTVQFDASVRTYSCQRLQYMGVTLTKADSSSYLDGADAGNFLRFKNCIWDANGIAAAVVSPAYRSHMTYIHNCTGDLGATNWTLSYFGASKMYLHFDGCTFEESNASAAAITPFYRVVACSGSNEGTFFSETTTSATLTQDNLFFDFNRFTNVGMNKPFLMLANAIAIARGVSLRGNLFERTSVNGSNAMVKLAADASAVDCAHAIVQHNTTAGERWNVGYNDTGSTARHRKHWSVKNNIFESLATKHDDFDTDNAARIGGWPVHYGVGWSGNLSPHCTGLGASGSFAHEFIGLHSYQPAASGNPPALTPSAIGYVGFTDREAYTGTAGAGNGDYTLQVSSPAVALPMVSVMSFDFTGAIRPALDAAGAYHYGTATTSNFLFFF